MSNPRKKCRLDQSVNEDSAKVFLALKLNQLIEKKRLSQIQVAVITRMTQSKISQVRHYKLQNISFVHLIQALVAFWQQVQIVVRPTPHSHHSGITIATQNLL